MSESTSDEIPELTPQEQRIGRIFELVIGLPSMLAAAGLRFAMKNAEKDENGILKPEEIDKVLDKISAKTRSLPDSDKKDLLAAMNESPENPFIGKDGIMPLTGIKITREFADKISQTIIRSVSSPNMAVDKAEEPVKKDITSFNNSTRSQTILASNSLRGMGVAGSVIDTIPYPGTKKPLAQNQIIKIYL